MSIGGIGQTPPYTIPEKCTHGTDCPKDARNMPGHRHRDKDGTLRAKSGATHLDTLEASRGEFSELPSDTHLKQLRALTGKRGINAVVAQLREEEGRG
jgi:hypothetical protein